MAENISGRKQDNESIWERGCTRIVWRYTNGYKDGRNKTQNKNNANPSPGLNFDLKKFRNTTQASHPLLLFSSGN
jgi:hypothetical protein